MAVPSMDQFRIHQIEKQGLLDKKYTSFEEVAQAALGLHSTDYWTPYISVWARIGDYNAGKEFERINSGKGYVRRPAFRNTHHVIHIDNHGLILRALGPRLERSMRPAPPIKDLSDSQLEQRLQDIIDVLSEGAHTITDLKKKLPDIKGQMRWLLLIANGRGLVLRTRGSHAKSNRLDYDLTRNWLPKFKMPSISEREALKELVFRHISHFGPVTIKDIAWWISLKIGETKEVISELEDRISRIKIEKKTYFIENDSLESVSSIQTDVKPKVFLLPYEDHFPKAYKLRSWYLDQQCKDVLFPRNKVHFHPPEMKPPPPGPPKGMNASGEIRPSIWVDGKIVGRWEVEVDKKIANIHIGIVSEVSKEDRKMIEGKRDELAEFITTRLIPIS